MKRIDILSLVLLSAILCTAADSLARDLTEKKTAGVSQEVTASAVGAPSTYPFTLDQDGIPGLDDERSVIVIISDLHLGMDDRFAEIQKNRAPLVGFLQKLRRAPNIKELVIAGDLLDEWFIPADRDTYAGKSQKEFAQTVAANNKEVVDAFNDIIRDGTIKVTYVPGNHDLPLWFKPNAGQPDMQDGKAVYAATPDGFVQGVQRLVDAGAVFVGGCCGTSPAFIQALAAGIRAG